MQQNSFFSTKVLYYFHKKPTVNLTSYEVTYVKFRPQEVLFSYRKEIEGEYIAKSPLAK